MPTISLPNTLAPAYWAKPKAALAKVPKVPNVGAPIEDDLKTISKRYGEVDWSLFSADKLKSAAEVEERMRAVDEAHRSKILKLTAQVDSTVQKAADFAKLCKAEKQFPKEPIDAALAIARDAKAFSAEVDKVVDSVRNELKSMLAKLKAGEKKPAAGAAAAPASPKALADAKTVSALIRKSIALLRTPKGSPVPVRFMVLSENKKFRIYLGPRPENGLAKLKTQFGAKAKLKRVKDPKGQVVWEKGALTFLSDLLKGGLVKQLQIAIREQTKVNVKVRIKRSDGGTEEADAPDLTDDQLKVDPAEEAEMLAAGKAYDRRLKELQPQIEVAAKGKSAARLKALVASITAAGKAQKYADASDLLDELESLLEEGDVTDSDGKDLEVDDDAAPGAGDKEVAPAKALLAKFAALRSKIDAAVAVGGATGKQIKEYADAAEKLARTGAADNVAKANLFVSKIEQMLGDAASAAAGGISVQKLTAARKEWVDSRDSAVKGITDLSKAIAAAFAKEAAQAPAVKDAIKKLGELQVKLKSGLDSDLEAAIKAKDEKARSQSASKAKDSIKSIRKFIEEDELMKNLDNNEIIRTMSVVGPMKSSLLALEAALG